jgi:beta-glucanase (GH16 family)
MHRYGKRCCVFPAVALSALAVSACDPYDNSGLKLVFQDNFDGTKLDLTKWRPYNSSGHNGNGLRRPEAFSLDGKGNLVVTAKMVAGEIVSGGMSARQGYAYGRYAIRVRTETDPTEAMSGVVLTWPQSGDSPPDGENDIYETGATNLRRPFFTYIHYGGYRGDPQERDQQYRYVHDADGSQWQNIVMDWSPDVLRIYRDGRLVANLKDKAAIPDVVHTLRIQLDARYDRPLARPVRMYVDYVKVYLPA